MPIEPVTRKSLRYLIAQVAKQLKDTDSILNSRILDETRVEKLLLREPQIDVLKASLKSRALRELGREQDASESDTGLVQAVSAITDNLESIADYCASILTQVRHLSVVTFFHRFHASSYLKPIIDTLDLILPGIFDRNIDHAIRICSIEGMNDRQFKKHLAEIIADLKKGEHVEDLLSSVFILRYLERIGDALLNIGEAMIGAIVGEPLKFTQFLALEASLGEGLTGLTDRPQGITVDDIHFESVAETRSGCRIGRVRDRHSGDRWALFKEGAAKKIIEEREGIRRWEQVGRGLTPHIFHFSQSGEQASLLLEMLDGRTFQRITIDGTNQEMRDALRSLTTCLEGVWSETKHRTPAQSTQADQLEGRVDEVLKLHPSFDTPQAGIGELELPSLKRVLSVVREIEADLSVPFTVLIHGDMNTDNILYDSSVGRIHFVDLHRARLADYLQDASVFMLSNFRLPVFEATVRERLDHVVVDFLAFVRGFARQHGDAEVNARLAIGLIRSFITSTRFVLSRDFAKAMFLRAIYLVERLSEHRGSPWSEFHLPEEVFTYR